ncbi:hypothetical protein [Variovorax sp. UMC13]|uniref:hypothetical protein n=1 Tax=Variovorax sp. UMC13 TaxID=1862326 RepID=UPI001601F544|nr:hypothetical protein [Variovorax sp. UMC13]
MATTPKKDPPPTARQELTQRIAVAMISSIGYELLDEKNGEVAAALATRAVQLADAVIASTGGAS